MVYNRFWFLNNKFGLTLGGGAITNPGRYLVLTPPINGSTAANVAVDPSTGNPYFSQNPGDQFVAWDSSITADYMPNQWITFRVEYIHRHSSVPYFAGPNGITPNTQNGSQLPNGSNIPTSPVPTGWEPDLAQDENRIDTSLMVRL